MVFFCSSSLDALAVHRDLTSVQLPKHIFVFALNTMAPQLVNFLDALANHCDIHIFQERFEEVKILCKVKYSILVIVGRRSRAQKLLLEDSQAYKCE